MLADLDETIREFLIRYAPLETSEIDISFETPDRDWSSRLSRPTVNCFLFDIRENHDLRQTGWEVTRENGAYTRKKEPLRFDVTYQISVWAQAAEDEHRLLWHVLSTLARNSYLPEDVFQGEVQSQPNSIPSRVAQPEEGPRNMAELWQAIDNRVRPSVTYILTVALDPEVVSTGSLVLSRTSTLSVMPERDPLPDAANPDLVDSTFGGRRLRPTEGPPPGTMAMPPVPPGSLPTARTAPLARPAQAAPPATQTAPPRAPRGTSRSRGSEQSPPG
jgi:hypothetical protein